MGQEHDNELIYRLLADVAGQLRCALGNMSGAFQRIVPPEARDGDAELDANAALLYQSYYRMLRLVNHLSEAAELGSEAELPLRNQDIVALCRAVCRCAESLAQMQGLTLRFSSQEEEHILALNAEGIEKLLLNLLSNAMKFTPRGGHILVSLDFDGAFAVLTVTDTGCGIPQALLPTLFDRFRHTGRMDPPVHGLGLGLPLCHRIAAGHGGEISAASTVGAGTGVTVKLPDRRVMTARFSDIRIEYAGGLNPTLLELADAVSCEAFRGQYLD